MSSTAIQWTEHVWNPTVGCSILSPGCTNCYAMNMAARIEAMNLEAEQAGKPIAAPQYDGTTKKVNGHAVWTGKLALSPQRVLLQPLKRKKPTMYFVNSMSDLFHESIPDEWIDKVFAVMALCPQHTFQCLTKRAKRMREYFAPHDKPLKWVHHACQLGKIVSCYDVADPDVAARWGRHGLPNVWLGVSTERQQEADERIPELLQTPAAVRFISAEPLLGPIDLSLLSRREPGPSPENGEIVNAVAGEIGYWPSFGAVRKTSRLDWVITGGESGADARPMHPDWARSLRDQCIAAGVPFFFKQWGEFAPLDSFSDAESDGKVYRCGKKAAGRHLDGRLHDDMPQRADGKGR